MSISEILDKLIGHTDVWCETSLCDCMMNKMQELEKEGEDNEL